MRSSLGVLFFILLSVLCNCLYASSVCRVGVKDGKSFAVVADKTSGEIAKIYFLPDYENSENDRNGFNNPTLQKRWVKRVEDALYEMYYEGVTCHIRRFGVAVCSKTSEKIQQCAVYKAIKVKNDDVKNFFRPVFVDNTLEESLLSEMTLLGNLEFRASKSVYRRESQVEVWSRVYRKSSSRWHRFLNFWKNLFDYNADDGYFRVVVNFIKNSASFKTSLDSVARIHLYNINFEESGCNLVQVSDIKTGTLLDYPRSIRTFNLPEPKKRWTASNTVQEVEILDADLKPLAKLARADGQNRVPREWMITYARDRKLRIKAGHSGLILSKLEVFDGVDSAESAEPILTIKPHKIRNIIYGRHSWINFFRYGTHKYSSSAAGGSLAIEEMVITLFLVDYGYVFRL